MFSAHDNVLLRMFAGQCSLCLISLQLRLKMVPVTIPLLQYLHLAVLGRESIGRIAVAKQKMFKAKEEM